MKDLISREEALMALTGANLPTDRDKLIALFDKRIKALPTVEPQEWISVKKKGNPTRSDEYWVTVRHTTFESVERDYYSTTHGRWETLGEVIAWREVEPSPYKGE